MRRRWKEYVDLDDFNQAKNRPRGFGQGTVDEGEEEKGPEFFKEEILAAIRDMKINKAK